MKPLNKKEIKKFFKATEKRDKEIFLILENIEYAKNVANIFRIADAAAVRKVFLTGISKTPPFGKELRNASRSKELSVPWEAKDSASNVIDGLQKRGFIVIAIEITDKSKPVSELPALIAKHDKICFVAGSEVFGIKKNTLEKCDAAIYIPMYGKGASLNVSMSVAVTLFSF